MMRTNGTMQNKTIIGLAGRKQSGKTSAAKYLEKSGFLRFSFAEPMRKMLDSLLFDCGYYADEMALIYGLNKELPVAPFDQSPRYLLQTLGTEWGRDCVNPDLWVLVAKQKILFSESDYLVFDDVRFENEAAMIRSLGGLVIHIDRGDLVQDAHASEAGIKDHESDSFVDNDHTLDDFLLEISLVVAGYIGR